MNVCPWCMYFDGVQRLAGGQLFDNDTYHSALINLEQNPRQLNLFQYSSTSSVAVLDFHKNKLLLI